MFGHTASRVRLVILVVFLGGAGSAALAVFPLIENQFRVQDALSHGVPAPARILDLADTGDRINGQAVIAITLEVLPAGQPGYQAIVDQVITFADAAYFSRGNTVRVKYEPGHPDRIAILPGQ